MKSAYRRFHRAHAPGRKLPVCVCILGWLVAPASNTVKVISNEVGLRLLCWDVFHIHTFICGDPPQYQNFPKALLKKHEHVMHSRYRAQTSNVNVISPAFKRLLLAESELAFLISPSK